MKTTNEVQPEVMKGAGNLYLFECTGRYVATERQLETIGAEELPCANVHFSYAGYLEGIMPFSRPDKKKQVDISSYQVRVCTKCRACYVFVNEQMYDVTAMVDLEAWAKAERELHQATGPGGQC